MVAYIKVLLETLREIKIGPFLQIDYKVEQE